MPVSELPSVLDQAAKEYVVEVARTIKQNLSSDLQAAYLLGSAALGDYVPATSDLDIVGITTGPLSAEQKESLAYALSIERLPCPARRLEFVVYSERTAAHPQSRPPFELNFNTGRDTEDHASFDPSEEPAFWFVLDLAIARDHAAVLLGPPPTDVFGPVPRSWVIEALVESLLWHRDNAPNEHIVLSACRARRFVQEGVWSSKTDAATWVISRAAHPRLIQMALDHRHGRPADPLGQAAVQDFLAETLDLCREVLASCEVVERH
jgi:hypothetical protein